MATQVQFRRGTTGENAVFTGAIAEVTVDTSQNICIVHDGATPGGFPLLRQDGSNMGLSPGNLSSCALKFATDPNTGLISPGPDQLSLVTGGVIRATIDSSGTATFTGNVSIAGSLTVNGTFETTDNIALIVALS
jgi:hypothetical protein